MPVESNLTHSHKNVPKMPFAKEQSLNYCITFSPEKSLYFSCGKVSLTYRFHVRGYSLTWSIFLCATQGLTADMAWIHIVLNLTHSRFWPEMVNILRSKQDKNLIPMAICSSIIYLLVYNILRTRSPSKPIPISCHYMR